MNRAQLQQQLHAYLTQHPHIVAAWEAGSAATKTLDEYSDLDVLCVTKEDHVESTLQDILEHVRSTWKVDREFRLPEPTWHGFSQVFLSLKDTDNYVFLDLSVTKNTNPDLFTDQERHGIANVWIDKSEVYQEKHTSAEQIQAIRQRILNSLGLDFVIILELQKAMAREQLLDIQTNLMTFLQRFYAPVMNLVYRPEKADFGLRYVQRDWPQPEVDRLHQLFLTHGEEQKRLIQSLIDTYYQQKREIL